MLMPSRQRPHLQSTKVALDEGRQQPISSLNKSGDTGTSVSFDSSEGYKLGISITLCDTVGRAQSAEYTVGHAKKYIETGLNKRPLGLTKSTKSNCRTLRARRMDARWAEAQAPTKLRVATWRRTNDNLKGRNRNPAIPGAASSKMTGSHLRLLQKSRIAANPEGTKPAQRRKLPRLLSQGRFASRMACKRIKQGERT